MREIADMDPSQWTTPDDVLNLYFEPYYRSWNRRSGSYSLRICKGFESYESRSHLLDPFRRFSYKDFDAPADYISKRWDTPDAVGGYILEAMVACHMEHKEACFDCKAAKSLRWNGGCAANSAWTDMVCVQCKATYEIKSKHNQEKVLDNLIKFDDIRGGSFTAYSMYERGRKHFLVMVPRLPESNGFHPVNIALIDEVLPSLINASFDLRNTDRMRIGSRIKIKQGTRNTWCVIPAHPVSYFGAVSRAYDEVFGDLEWKRRNPDRLAWQSRGALFVRKTDDSSLSSTFQGLQITSSSVHRRTSPSNYARQSTHPRFTTIGPSQEGRMTWRNSSWVRDEERHQQASEDYHTATYNPRKDHKSRW